LKHVKKFAAINSNNRLIDGLLVITAGIEAKGQK